MRSENSRVLLRPLPRSVSNAIARLPAFLRGEDRAILATRPPQEAEFSGLPPVLRPAAQSAHLRRPNAKPIEEQLPGRPWLRRDSQSSAFPRQPERWWGAGLLARIA